MSDPFRQGLIDKQFRKGQRLIIACSHLPYKEILKFLKLSSLGHRRRRRVDLIMLYNIMHGFVPGAACPAIMPRRKDKRT